MRGIFVLVRVFDEEDEVKGLIRYKGTRLERCRRARLPARSDFSVFAHSALLILQVNGLS